MLQPLTQGEGAPAAAPTTTARRTKAATTKRVQRYQLPSKRRRFGHSLIQNNNHIAWLLAACAILGNCFLLSRLLFFFFLFLARFLFQLLSQSLTLCASFNFIYVTVLPYLFVAFALLLWMTTFAVAALCVDFHPRPADSDCVLHHKMREKIK